MPSSNIERKLAAIMFTDIAGYTELSAKDETKALELLDIQKQILTPIIEEFNGRLHKEMGDGLLFTFSTVTEAVKCGIKIQEDTKANDDLNLRIGIHEGEITLKDGDALGDDVNVASRIEAFAPSGGIAISNKVQQNISSLPEFETSYLGKPELKGVAQKVEVYCITSHGLPKTKELNVENNKTSSIDIKNKSKSILFVTIMMIIGFSIFYFYDFLNLKEKNYINPKSIAVLPFDNFSPNPEDEYLSDGFTEVIIANLAKVKDLMVISRTSVMRYKDLDMNLKEIAKELNVANILEGSIQRTENKIRVVGQLIEAHTDKHLWAETYDSDFDNIFSIQTSIAKQIVSSLKSQITESERSIIEEKLTDNIEAYDLYLKAKELNNKGVDNRKIVKELLKKILYIDSEFAEAYALLSIYYSEGVHFGFDKSNIEKAKQNIDKALSIKPESAYIQFAFGYYYYGCHKDYYRALKHYKVAIEKEPGNAKYNSYIGFLYRRLGNWDKMYYYFKQSNKLDPNSVAHIDFETEMFMKNYSNININYIHERLLKLSPESPYAYHFLIDMTYSIEGNTKNARNIMQYVEKIFPDESKWTEYYLNMQDGNYDKALQHIIKNMDSLTFNQKRILTKEGTIGDIYLRMGDKQKARSYYLSAIKTLSKLEGYNTDPRFYASMGLLHALVGDTSIAINEAKMAIELYPEMKDAFISDLFIINLAKVYSVIGEYEMSLDIIEELLNKPSNVDWRVKYDIIFDIFLGDNSRWKELIRIDQEKFHKEAKYDIKKYNSLLSNP